MDRASILLLHYATLDVEPLNMIAYEEMLSIFEILKERNNHSINQVKIDIDINQDVNQNKKR